MERETIDNLSLRWRVIGRVIIVALLAAGSILVVRITYAQSKAAVELEAAVTKEQVDGDLNAAITAYQRIAADAAALRNVRAKALLQLAGCYEKLGRQAQGVYQQIVREFGDQPVAAQARARLAALRRHTQPSAPATMTQRKIEIPGGSFVPQDTDGRRVVYRDDATGELIYSDPASKARRVIFKAKRDDLPTWMPSRDFSAVALYFEKKPSRPAFVAVVKIDGTGYRELVRDDDRTTIFARVGGIKNWSWDNRYLLVSGQSYVEGDGRLLVISTASGERREFIRQKTGWFDQCAFSPDGRFIAYQVSAKWDEDRRSSRIFVVPSEGGEPRLIHEESFRGSLRLLDWTADGRYLAIATARTGRTALHLFPVKDDQPAGAPLLVRYGNFDAGFTTNTGAMVYQSIKPGGLWALYVASLDQNSRPGRWQRVELRGDNQSTNNPWPEWSPDGNQILYEAEDAEGKIIVRLRNLSTGEDREIYHSSSTVSCTWAGQQPKLLCLESTTPDVFSIALESGETERLGAIPGPKADIIRASRDGLALYVDRPQPLLDRSQPPSRVTLRWDIATRQETILEVFPADVNPSMIFHDERWLVRPRKQHIEARPISGGDWKPLVSPNNSTRPDWHFAVTPNGDWLLYHDADAAGRQSLFRLPMTGGPPEHLGDFPTETTCCFMQISSGGGKVLVTSNEREKGFELWLLENFVPPTPRR